MASYYSGSIVERAFSVIVVIALLLGSAPSFAQVDQSLRWQSIDAGKCNILVDHSTARNFADRRLVWDGNCVNGLAEGNGVFRQYSKNTGMLRWIGKEQREQGKVTKLEESYSLDHGILGKIRVQPGQFPGRSDNFVMPDEVPVWAREIVGKGSGARTGVAQNPGVAPKSSSAPVPVGMSSFPAGKCKIFLNVQVADFLSKVGHRIDWNGPCVDGVAHGNGIGRSFLKPNRLISIWKGEVTRGELKIISEEYRRGKDNWIGMHRNGATVDMPIANFAQVSPSSVPEWAREILPGTPRNTVAAAPTSGGEQGRGAQKGALGSGTNPANPPPGHVLVDAGPCGIYLPRESSQIARNRWTGPCRSSLAHGRGILRVQLLSDSAYLHIGKVEMVNGIQKTRDPLYEAYAFLPPNSIRKMSGSSASVDSSDFPPSQVPAWAREVTEQTPSSSPPMAKSQGGGSGPTSRSQGGASSSIAARVLRATMEIELIRPSDLPAGPPIKWRSAVAGRSEDELRRNADALAKAWASKSSWQNEGVRSVRIVAICNGPGFVMEARVAVRRGGSTDDGTNFGGCFQGKTVEEQVAEIRQAEAKLVAGATEWAYYEIVFGYVDETNFFSANRYENILGSRDNAHSPLLGLLPRGYLSYACHKQRENDRQLRNLESCYRQGTANARSGSGG